MINQRGVRSTAFMDRAVAHTPQGMHLLQTGSVERLPCYALYLLVLADKLELVWRLCQANTSALEQEEASLEVVLVDGESIRNCHRTKVDIARGKDVPGCCGGQVEAAYVRYIREDLRQKPV